MTIRFVGVLHDDPLGVQPVRAELARLIELHGPPTKIAVEADPDFHDECKGRRDEFRQMLDASLRGGAINAVAGEFLDACKDTLSFEAELAEALVNGGSIIWLDQGRRGHSGNLMAFRLKLFLDALRADPNVMPADQPWAVDIADSVAALNRTSSGRRNAADQSVGVQGVQRDQDWFDAIEQHWHADADGWIAVICGAAHATKNGGDYTVRRRLIDAGRVTEAYYPAWVPPQGWDP